MHVAFAPPNLAVRRTVRFWQSWLGMLAATLPAWLGLLVIAMAFPLIRGGKIVFKGGKPAFGTCADCGCTGGVCGACDACLSSNDCFGCTPLTMTCTFADVENAMTCGSGNTGFGYAGTGVLGTYTLTQAGAGTNACKWGFAGTGPSYNYGGTFDCTDTILTNGLRVVLDRSIVVGGVHKTKLDAFLTTTTPGRGTLNYFHSSLDNDTLVDCETKSYTNTNLAYGNGIGEGEMINGTAVVTPC